MKNKKVIILISTVVAFLLVILLTLGIVYAKTDIFKTNQELFYKYASQIEKNLEDFKNDKVERYIERTQTTPYKTDGKLSFDIDTDKLPEKQLKAVNDLNITFSGKTNNINRKSEQKININYSEDITFPIEYINTKDLYGISSDKIITKYIAVDTKNLEELVKKFMPDNTSIYESDDNNTEKYAENIPTANDMKEIADKLIEIIKTNLAEASYAKAGNDEFALILNQQQVAKISREFVDEISSRKILPKENIEEIYKEITKIEKNATTQPVLRITVNKEGIIKIEFVEPESSKPVTIGLNVQKKDEIKIWVKMGDEDLASVTITKVEGKNEVTYNIEGFIDKFTIHSNINYSNLISEVVNEKYELELSGDEMGAIFGYTLDITNEFDEGLTIKELSDENAITVNDVSGEYIIALFTLLPQKIMEVNQSQMDSLGYKQNPLIFTNPITFMEVQDDEEESQENIEEIQDIQI